MTDVDYEEAKKRLFVVDTFKHSDFSVARVKRIRTSPPFHIYQVLLDGDADVTLLVHISKRISRSAPSTDLVVELWAYYVRVLVFSSAEAVAEDTNVRPAGAFAEAFDVIMKDAKIRYQNRSAKYSDFEIRVDAGCERDALEVVMLVVQEKMRDYKESYTRDFAVVERVDINPQPEREFPHDITETL